MRVLPCAAKMNVTCQQVLGVSPFESFDKIKVAFTRKQKDAEKRGDDATLSRVGIYGLFLVPKIVNFHF